MSDTPEMNEDHSDQEIRIAISPYSDTVIPVEVKTRKELESLDGDQTQVVATIVSSPCSGGCINQTLTAVCYRCNLPICESCKEFCSNCLQCIGKCHLKIVTDDSAKDEPPKEIPFCDLCYAKYKKHRFYALILKLLLFPFWLLVEIFFEPPEEDSVP